jgi:mannose-6-phosphate isomerase
MTSSRLQNRARQWACSLALPLWSSNGFQAREALFVERLDFSGAPIASPARRLMVQARQIATYSRAILGGFVQPCVPVDDCIDSMMSRYYRSDGSPGCVFSVGPDLKPLDRTRDLYAHAFVLYALGWSYSLLRERRLLQWADEILQFLDDHGRRDDGTYADCLPPKDNTRRQNPQMHLLEALLVLAEVTGDDRYLRRAIALAQAVLRCLTDPRTGLLLEEAPSGSSSDHRRRVEPGHLFEWSWLLRELQRLSGLRFDHRIKTFLSFAHERGIESRTQLVLYAVDADGSVIDGRHRCWPHTEAIKAHKVEAKLRGAPSSAQVDHFLNRLFDVFIPERLGGGWVDLVDQDHKPLVDHMPASSLYHIMGAIFAVADTSSLASASRKRAVHDHPPGKQRAS